MLHFFRKIRRDLLANSQTIKYLKYGIGEIILVVIGILIAIQVDNWNEGRIDAENNKILFQSVSDELVQNIEEIDRILDIYINEQPYYFKVLHKKVDYEDYKNGFPYLPNRWQRTNLTDGDFRELLSEKKNLTELQDSILAELRDLYGKRKLNADKDEEEIADWHFYRRMKWMDEHPWQPDLFGKRIRTDEFIEYLLTDPSYINEVTEIQLRNLGHQGGMIRFRTQALNVYKEIMKMIKKELDTSLVRDIKDFGYIKGVYEAQFAQYDGLVGRCEIKGDEEVKFFAYWGEDETAFEWDIHPYSDSVLIFYEPKKIRSYLGKIVSGSDGEILGLDFIGFLQMDENGNKIIYKKIE